MTPPPPGKAPTGGHPTPSPPRGGVPPSKGAYIRTPGSPAYSVNLDGTPPPLTSWGPDAMACFPPDPKQCGPNGASPGWGL